MLKMTIWNREFIIKECFDCYEGEEITQYQKDAFSNFMEDYQKIIDSILPDLVDYCLKNNRDEIGSDEITNIFKYVIPTTLFVKRNKNSEHVIAIICNYKFNPDDGLSIVFKDNKLIEIGTENVII